ncbi:hypothetical protein CONPUDRAFT_39384, partial [Coniophora puteana RWD-64-598 SS2]
SLVRHGVLGCSPIQPTVAVTLRSLEAFRQAHRVCPRLSIHAQAKMLCHLHRVPYRPYLARQFRDAYDVYLEITRRIDQRVGAALNHVGPNWRMLNSCPACQYRLRNEPPLTFSMMCAMDGNNSLKLVDPKVRSGTERFDPRCGQSDIWLSETFVDGFKDEVNAAQSASPPQIDPGDPDSETSDLPSDSAGEPTDACIDRWRNAAPESRKKMFAVFKKSGIFVSFCRHGFLLTICDMVRSGELMKYPLATIKKLLDVFGDDVCFGYDIKCRFFAILLRSSLGPQAIAQRLHGVVPAFHGHAHNRYCQLNHFSKYTTGTGKEDFETSERVFSESNGVAALVRFTTEFHRHQDIDEFFHFSDSEKYANLAKFVYNNYVQATSIIKSHHSRMAALSISPPMTAAQFDADLVEEREYLKRVHGKREEDSAELDYVNIDNSIIHEGFTRKEISNVNRQFTLAYNKLNLQLRHVEEMERSLSIDPDARWGSDNAQRARIQKRIANRLFYKAADDVERLVAMRLMEMTKLQMSGYKLRTQISKALRTRATAIRNAIDRYNKYAAELDPPAEPLDWDKIAEYSFLSEFDVLRETDADIHTKWWAKPVVRQAALLHYDYVRAQEEITRCHVEIKRLLTKIRDDELDYPAAIKRLAEANSPLTAELEKRWETLHGVNVMLLVRIQQMQALPGYSGPMGPG